ncbi:MAG: GNAT family N-acetyltransferase [Thermaerobacter sp.]|nr:GNAT family N-acetyltransferase [Thermaerobacter sp.]
MPALPTLEDGDLRLRPVSLPGDIEVAWSWYQDKQTLALSQRPGTEPLSRDRVARMYQYQVEHGDFYIIEVRDQRDGGLWRPIGDVMLAPDTLPIVIGDPSARRQGIGRRVLALLIARARQLGWPTLQAKEIWLYNVGSRRLFQSAGFVLAATGVDPGGQPYERYRLDLRPPD